MTKEEKRKREVAEAVIIKLYDKYINKKETTTKAVSLFFKGGNMKKGIITLTI